MPQDFASLPAGGRAAFLGASRSRPFPWVPPSEENGLCRPKFPWFHIPGCAAKRIHRIEFAPPSCLDLSRKWRKREVSGLVLRMTAPASGSGSLHPLHASAGAAPMPNCSLRARGLLSLARAFGAFRRRKARLGAKPGCRFTHLLTASGVRGMGGAKVPPPAAITQTTRRAGPGSGAPAHFFSFQPHSG